LTQDTNGEGIPDALQCTVTLPRSSTISFCLSWMDGGTVKRQQ